jgi:hypothetical protein
MLMTGRFEPEGLHQFDADPGWPIDCPTPDVITTREACLEQLLAAFVDISDRDDIHQAAARLSLVQDWIGREAALAAADPIFAPRRLAS